MIGDGEKPDSQVIREQRKRIAELETELDALKGMSTKELAATFQALFDPIKLSEKEMVWLDYDLGV